MARKGEHLSEETKQKLREQAIGRIISEDTRRKLGEASKRYWQNPEYRERIPVFGSGEQNINYGRTFSEETLKKMSESHMGKKLGYPRSQEYRDKIRATRLGKKHSEETKQKISRNRKGKMQGNSHFAFGKKKANEIKMKVSNTRKENGCAVRERNPAWKGGISFEPYCPKFNKKFKERVKAFFGNICIECGTPQNDKTRLAVHHVNYNKMVCCNDVKPLFVSLCPSCNAKANSKREYWEQHFTNMINEYYGGICYLTQEEMRQYKSPTT